MFEKFYTIHVDLNKFQIIFWKVSHTQKLSSPLLSLKNLLKLEKTFQRVQMNIWKFMRKSFN